MPSATGSQAGLLAVGLLAALLGAASGCPTDQGVVGAQAARCSDDAACGEGQRCDLARGQCEPCGDAGCAPMTEQTCPQDAAVCSCSGSSDCSDALPFCVEGTCRMCRDDPDCASNQCEDGSCVPAEPGDSEDGTADP